MKIIRNNIIPFKGFAAINICGILFVRNGVKITDTLINHESIHTAQMKELWFVGFYLLYVLEWLWLMLNGISSNEAYHAISFEKEAYDNQANLAYLDSRKPFSQWNNK